MSVNLSVVPDLRIYRPVVATGPENSSFFRDTEVTVRYNLNKHGYRTEDQADLLFLETPRMQLLPEDEYQALHKLRDYRRLGTRAVAQIIDLELDKRMALRYKQLPVDLTTVDVNYRPDYIEVGYLLTSPELQTEEEICVNALREITHSTARRTHIPKPFLAFARLQYGAPQIFETLTARAATPASTDPRLVATLGAVHIDDLSYKYPD